MWRVRCRIHRRDVDNNECKNTPNISWRGTGCLEAFALVLNLMILSVCFYNGVINRRSSSVSAR